MTLAPLINGEESSFIKRWFINRSARTYFQDVKFLLKRKSISHEKNIYRNDYRLNELIRQNKNNNKKIIRKNND